MRFKIHSSEMNRMMKTIVQCIDSRDTGKRSAVCLTHEDNLLKLRATNGVFSAEMSSPVLGGDGESLCVDGTMLAKVCAMCSGEIDIGIDGKTCTVKGAGRTRIPVMPVDVPEMQKINGEKWLDVAGESFSKCYESVAYAVSTDQSRLVLTGILVETDRNGVRMVALDGFQMAIEETDCDWGNGVKAIVPGAFMKLVNQSVSSGERLKMTFSDAKVQAETDGMVVSCALLSGEFVDYKRILPAEFKTECLVKTEDVKNALKSGGVVNAGNNLAKMRIEPTKLTVMSNSERADYDAEVDCDTNGDGLLIAFNQKYIMNAMNVVGTDEAVMKFNTPFTPCVISGRESRGIHLVLPVRTAAGDKT